MSHDAVEDLLRYCVRSDWDSANAGELESVLRRMSDWPAALRLLRYHKLSVAFYHLLVTAQLRDAVPADVATALRAEYMMGALFGAIRERALRDLLRSFAGRVPAMVLKGSHLSDAVYSAGELRPSGDIDLFVQERDLPAAVSLLEQLGYEVIEREEEGFAFPWRTTYPAVCAIGQCAVDLHWYFPVKKWFGRCGLDMAKIWGEASLGRLRGAPAYEMSCEHLLFYLCLHLAVQHQFARLIWFRDIGELIRLRGDVMDWESVIGLAVKHKAAAGVYFCLKYCRDLGLESCPRWVLDRLRPRHVLGRLFEAAATPCCFVRTDSLRSAMVLGAWPLVRDQRRDRMLALVKWPASVVQGAFRQSFAGRYVRGTAVWAWARRATNRALASRATTNEGGVHAR